MKIDKVEPTVKGRKTFNTEFREKLESDLNGTCMENGSDTPDFILAEYLINCLENFDNTVNKREKWYGRK